MASLLATRLAPRYLAAAVGVSLALTLPTGVSMAADAPSDDSLCSTIGMDQLHELGPLRFETILLDSPEFCAYGPSPQGGTPTLSLVTIGLSLDSMLGVWPDATEIMVGDRTAAIAEGAVHVDYGDGILSVTLDLGRDTDSGVDAIEYAIDVAEIVVAARDAVPDPGGTASAASSLVALPEVPGIEWGPSQGVVSAQEVMEDDERQVEIWQPMLDSTGADAAEMFILGANARDEESGAVVGSYAAIQIVGIDESALLAAFVDLMRTTGEEVSMEDLTLGGKDVQRLAAGDETRGYLYLVGDTAHTFTMPEEDAARLLESMP